MNFLIRLRARCEAVYRWGKYKIYCRRYSHRRVAKIYFGLGIITWFGKTVDSDLYELLVQNQIAINNIFKLISKFYTGQNAYEEKILLQQSDTVMDLLKKHDIEINMLTLANCDILYKIIKEIYYTL